ncbi:MAG: C40 family peptidase [Oscillospiraceae bacterium]|nr:C40 family peptidase [Oscillospiraceae bacterium]
MTRQAVQKAGKAADATAAAFKKTAVVITKAAASLVSTLAGVAGGGVLLLAMVTVIVIAAVANSPFGLFFAQEPNAPGTVSVAQAVGTINAAYNSRLELLQSGDYDAIDVQGQAPDWAEVLAVFAVKTAGADVGGLDVATLDTDRVDKLTAVFWDMTEITVTEETIEHEDSNPDDDIDDSWTEKLLHITITPQTADDMRINYSFTDYQNDALDELLSDRAALSSMAGSLAITSADVREVLAALPADLEQARQDTVQTALQLVGKVNYFWGGKSSAIGWDPRWGTLQKVTAAGSPSTGTYRPFGLDCSGMIDWVLRNCGLHSDGNWYIGTNLTAVSQADAQPGDFALYPDASHIGIVVGRNDAGKLLVCHCSSGRNNVVVTEFSASGFTVVGRPDIFDP